MRHTLRGVLPAVAAAGLLGLGACISLDSPNQGGNCAGVGSLTIGVTHLDSLTTASCRLTDQTWANAYLFHVDSQANLVLSLAAPGGLVTTWLTDSTGAMIASSQVTQSPDTTATVRMILGAGSYEVVANSYLTTPPGAFRMTVKRDSTAVAGPASVVWVTKAITTTQTITAGDHTDGPLGLKYYYHLFLRWVPSGGQVQLTEHATAFRPGAQVANLQGATLAVSSLDSTLSNAVVSYGSLAGDILLLWIGSADSLQTGPYKLSVN